MKVKDFKDKKVLIIGLGLHGGGVSVANFFISSGAIVTITDLKTKSQLKDSLKKLASSVDEPGSSGPTSQAHRKHRKVKLVLGKHRKEDFINTDLVVKNPDVPNNSPYLKIARKEGIEIKNDVEIFFDLVSNEVIGITGTKGKSTTATLIKEVLDTKYHTILAGNIGISPLQYIHEIKRDTKVVLELSSFILEDLKTSPHIAVITNLFKDHLNRYKTYGEYKIAKKNIFKYQTKDDILIVNKNIKVSAKSRVYLSDGSSDDIARIIGKLYNIKADKIIKDFTGLAHRQEFVREKNGVKYYNDTTATNPTSVEFALDTFKDVVLIAGGKDKKLSYKSLALKIKDKVKVLILLPGTATELLKKELKDFKYYEVKTMNGAVLKASKLSQKGDTVLLSPGASSFNLFDNEFDRGDQFRLAVKNL